MTVLLIAGSPTAPSRSQALLDTVGQRLLLRGLRSEQLQVRELDALALVQADFGHPAVVRAAAQVAAADAVVIATPVYKAAYSGVLKAFLDLLPQTGLKGKTVLPLATGGSPHHMLALDYALRPVLQSLGARQILPGVYATESQVVRLPEGPYQVHADLALRLVEAVDLLVTELLPRGVAPGFDPVPFSQVRCSV
ncbi:NADPH-dependent FMN reductase [Xylophilus ampelinus]|uniref:SsuE family FMN reductase n=1 Tax=Xylophilus ampelinus TaxID=54067 RepID=A0A318T162_9BURK|nr:NADPH-dependent FMN reductase [Xylophilus ampelinus]MCS4508724.1 NADPH-dependent FMN reductase [Xylophilus ampelinus]PYE79291.1 SsuE family FMN reductase [Xylophilus ampelinus]